MGNTTLVLCVITVFCVQNYVADSARIVCFTGFWSREYQKYPMNYDLSYVPAEACDVLVYAFVTVNINSWKIDHRYQDADIANGGFRQAVQIKKQNPRLKVILSFGGVPYQGVGEVIHYSSMMAQSLRRTIFVQSAVEFLRTHKFDGLDLQWYYPGSSDKDNYLLLVQELHAAFAQDNFSLTATVPYLRSQIEAGFKVAELNKYLDYFHVRTLNMNEKDKFTADNASPLRKRSWDVGGSEPEVDSVESVLELYVSLGVPKEKLVFAIPFEHHVFSLRDPLEDHLRAPAIGLSNIQGQFSKNGFLIYYHEVCARILSGMWIPKRDEETGIPYAVQHQTREWVSYEDERTLTDKVKFLKEEGYGGLYVWLMDNDDFKGLCGEKHGLLKTIKREMMAPT